MVNGNLIGSCLGKKFPQGLPERDESISATTEHYKLHKTGIYYTAVLDQQVT